MNKDLFTLLRFLIHWISIKFENIYDNLRHVWKYEGKEVAMILHIETPPWNLFYICRFGGWFIDICNKSLLLLNQEKILVFSLIRYSTLAVARINDWWILYWSCEILCISPTFSTREFWRLIMTNTRSKAHWSILSKNCWQKKPQQII